MIFQQEKVQNHPKVRHGHLSASSRTGMHEGDRPPAPLRFHRTTWCHLVMTHDDGVGDVSAVQTTPPSEIHLAAHVQDVHKMIADHIALTTLASHKLFSDHVLTGSGESDSA